MVGSSPRVWGTCRPKRMKWRACSVHPHVCGEHEYRPAGWTQTNGSSPRVWGTSFLRLRVVQRQRFIPTCVGNMLAKTCAFRCAHGSSPRVWGTLRNGPAWKVRLRFIPTCVGNICAQDRRLLAHAVHPHVCGEHTTFTSVRILGSGSSPRVWGTCRGEPPNVTDYRFIPTCVGNITRWRALASPPTVHPHVCGEHLSAEFISAARLRFIPTCVGNISPSASTAPQEPVHPHVCGEHYADALPPY